MHAQRRAMAWINVLGGIAVLGSYAHGLLTNVDTRALAWGGVPESLRPLYTVNMLLAAAGYFLFTYYLFLRVDPDRVRVGRRGGLGLFNLIYVGILVPSALWMPLTFAMLEAPSAGLWWAIRLVLALVGVSSVALVVGLLRVQPRESALAHRLAVAGSLPFALQTAVLDALIWPAYFPV